LALNTPLSIRELYSIVDFSFAIINSMPSPNKLHEGLGIALTGARYLLAERVARRVRDDKPIALDMAILVAADVFDGVLLRKLGLDTPARRVADGVVDHLSVARVMGELAKKNHAAQPYIGILAARAAVVGTLNAEHWRQTGEVTKGGANQKATNLAMAAFGMIATKGNDTLTHIAGGVASGIAIGTAFAHTKDMGVTHEEGIRKL
jgi:hypothetical protein